MRILGRDVPVSALRRGDILLTIADWRNPIHWAVAAGTRSQIVHGALYLGCGVEVGMQAAGSETRTILTDRFQVALRANHPHAAEIGEAAASYAEKHPIKGYAWQAAGWIGMQTLLGDRTPERLPRVDQARYCFEWLTDICVAIGYDVVPDIENGAVLGWNIWGSPLLAEVA